MSGTSSEGMVRRSYSSPPSYKEVMAGLPENHKEIRTLGDLLGVNYKMVGARDQMRRNLASLLDSGGRAFPGIVGYDGDVLPAIYRAVLAGHDMLLVGQMGQAKTRLAQAAATLLSPMPVISGSITGDCPLGVPARELAALIDDRPPERPSPRFYLSPESASRIRDCGLDTGISWEDGPSRFRYVLATPDISVKDLVGYVDAVKVARSGLEMYRIDSYSPGQLMQARHGIICIDELPVLDPRKQVALLSVLEEGRFTTGAYPVTFEPGAVLFATANPVDYTHSGKVIEPLYDRLKSHVHTHYPGSADDETRIIMQEARTAGVGIPAAILLMLARLLRRMRGSPRINQERGVSVRLGIHGLEILAGEALRCRSRIGGERPAIRPSDLYCLEQVAKFELTDIDDGVSHRRALFSGLLEESVSESCLEVLADVPRERLDAIRSEFAGRTFPVSQGMAWSGAASYESHLSSFDSLRGLVDSRRDDFMLAQREAAALPGAPAGLKFGPGDEGSLMPVLLEIILEGLCWTDPKILERRDAGYAQR